MKSVFFFLLLFFNAFMAWSGDMLITSLERDGRICWTNSRPDARYWIQYASDLAGPWMYLPNQGQIELTGNMNSSSLSNWLDARSLQSFPSRPEPLFLRILTDSPPPAPVTNTFAMMVFDSQVNLMVTGRLECVFSYTNHYSKPRGFEMGGTMTGTRYLEAVGAITNELVKQWMVGQGPIRGDLSINFHAPLSSPYSSQGGASSEHHLHAKFVPPEAYWYGCFDGQLEGSSQNGAQDYSHYTSFSGIWSVMSVCIGEYGQSPHTSGTFTAIALP